MALGPPRPLAKIGPYVLYCRHGRPEPHDRSPGSSGPQRPPPPIFGLCPGEPTRPHGPPRCPGAAARRPRSLVVGRPPSAVSPPSSLTRFVPLHMSHSSKGKCAPQRAQSPYFLPAGALVRPTPPAVLRTRHDDCGTRPAGAASGNARGWSHRGPILAPAAPIPHLLAAPERACAACARATRGSLMAVGATVLAPDLYRRPTRSRRARKRPGASSCSPPNASTTLSIRSTGRRRLPSMMVLPIKTRRGGNPQ